MAFFVQRKAVCIQYSQINMKDEKSAFIETLTTGTPEGEAGQAEAPLQQTQRLPALDVLRGFALLGILMTNVEAFAGPEGLWGIPVGLPAPAFMGWHSGLDYAIVMLKWMFVEGKMRSMFSMLFGAGVVLLTGRLEERSGAVRAAGIYYRRNLCLLVFGLCHGFLLFFGDILVDYSVMGLVVLYPLRRLGSKALLILGLTVWLVGGTFGSTRGFDVAGVLHADAELIAAKAAGASASVAQRNLLQAAENQQQGSAAVMQETIRVERLGFLAGLSGRIATEPTILKFKFGSFWILEWLGAMITGMGLYKSGFLINKRPVREYVRLMLAGYAIALPLILVGLWNVYKAGLTNAAFARWMAIPYTTEVMAGTLANTSILLLMVRSGHLRGVLATVASVGRTAFSNYILTTVICRFLFAWGPWKLYGRLEFYQWYVIVAGVWAINLIASSLWLRVFAFGPLEWLWRSLTYWKLQPILLQAEQLGSPIGATTPIPKS
jgi:uncharacterized protein